MKRKLKSQRGASILIALVLFLLAATVSVVILNAAETGVKRVRDDTFQQTDSLAVSSAAKLIAKCIKSSDVTITTTTTTIKDSEGNAESIQTETEYSSTGPLGPILRELVEYPAANSERVITLEQDGTACTFRFSVNPKTPLIGEYEDTSDPYKIIGNISVDGGFRKIFLTAWISNTPQYNVISDQKDIPVDDNKKKDVLVEQMRFCWDGVELNTTGGAQ